MSGWPEPPDVIESYLLGVLTDPPRHEVSLMFRDLSLRARGAEMEKLVRLLRAGAPDTEPAKIHFLWHS